MGKKVLLVDDNEFILKIQKALVQKITTNVTTCSSAEEAISLIKADASFEVVLMDMIMPGMSGCEAASVIREFNRSVKIIAVTGNNTPEDKQACKLAGMNGMLSKPLTIDRLQKALS